MKKNEAIQQGGGRNGWPWMASIKGTTRFEVEKVLNKVAIRWKLAGQSRIQRIGAGANSLNLRRA